MDYPNISRNPDMAGLEQRLKNNNLEDKNI